MVLNFVLSPYKISLELSLWSVHKWKLYKHHYLQPVLGLEKHHDDDYDYGYDD